MHSTRAVVTLYSTLYATLARFRFANTPVSANASFASHDSGVFPFFPFFSFFSFFSFFPFFSFDPEPAALALFFFFFS
jgi:hypothetical protein